MRAGGKSPFDGVDNDYRVRVANTPGGPIWIQVNSEGTTRFIQGAYAVTWQYYQESLRFDIDCPWE